MAVFLLIPIIALFGMLVSIGMTILTVIACKKIAICKGLSQNYMWLGLVGLIGMIIIAFLEPDTTPNYVNYTAYPPPSYPPPPPAQPQEPPSNK